MNQNVNPEKRKETGATGPQKRYIVSQPPKNISYCKGCPYPSVGFICWNPDGTCMKTDVDGINRRSKGR